jgi:hypothetical protein
VYLTETNGHVYSMAANGSITSISGVLNWTGVAATADGSLLASVTGGTIYKASSLRPILSQNTARAGIVIGTIGFDPLDLYVRVGAASNLYSSTRTVTSAWHFLSVSRSGNTYTLSIDGAAPVAYTVSGAIEQAGNLIGGLSISATYSEATKYFAGQLKNLRVYHKALSRSETTSVYNSER